jgi:hypothetical protein
MPRYFFHRTNGKFERDREGIVLPDFHSVRKKAILYAGQTLEHHPEVVENDTDMRIEVTDESGTMLFMVTVFVTTWPVMLQ